MLLTCICLIHILAYTTGYTSCSSDSQCTYCKGLDYLGWEICQSSFCYYRPNPSYGMAPCPDPCSPAPGAYCASGYWYTSCPAGSYCPGNTNSPIPCNAGTYCPAGSAAPISCVVGNFCPAGSASASSCAAGFYCPDTSSQLACTASYFCPVGSVAPTPCKTVACAAGNVLSKCGTLTSTDTDVCLPCPANSYCPNTTSVLACPVGAGCLADRLSNTTFTPCSIGYKCGGGINPPAPCPLGSFSNVTGSSFCYTCPVGTYANALASTSCIPSSSGYRYIDIYNKSVPCPIGTFSNTSGSSLCYTCPASTFAATPASTACVSCAMGATSLPGSEQCYCMDGWHSGSPDI
jgi:hypothetical protein